jgi:hypothetical protein
MDSRANSPNPLWRFSGALYSATWAWLVFLLLACCLPALSADSRLNLPQLSQSIPLDDAARSAVREYFSHPGRAGELPASLQNLLVHNLLESYRNTCTSIVGQWGTADPAATNFLRVRLLDYQGNRAWLAFRCGAPELDTGGLYDERPALLRTDTSTLELLPLGPDKGDDDVYQIKFIRRLRLKNAEGFSFDVTARQNPCCEGPETRSQEHLVVFADTPRGAVESFSVETARDDLSHCDDPEVDTESTSQSEVKFERDAEGFESTATVRFHQKVVDTHWESGVARPVTVSDQSGTLHFRWNPIIFKFEQIH